MENLILFIIALCGVMAVPLVTLFKGTVCANVISAAFTSVIGVVVGVVSGVVYGVLSIPQYLTKARVWVKVGVATLKEVHKALIALGVMAFGVVFTVVSVLVAVGRVVVALVRNSLLENQAVAHGVGRRGDAVVVSSIAGGVVFGIRTLKVRCVAAWKRVLFKGACCVGARVGTWYRTGIGVVLAWRGPP
jgi:hypothetical protein